MSIKLEDQDLSKLSPMMQHYLQTKKEYPGCILFYRLGDFYEMFFDDAEIVSRELELTLTGKSCGLPERAPMCGVPFHALDSYLTRLVEKGYKAAICDQVEDPRTAKGMVKREVTRIVTPGTNLDMESLEEGKNNFIFCILYSRQGLSGISVADVTTGEFYMTQTEGDRKIYDEIIRCAPAEIVCNDEFMLSGLDLQDLTDRLGIIINPLGVHYFDEAAARNVILSHFHVSSLIALGMDDKRTGSIAAGALLKYLYDTQMNALSNITGINVYTVGKYMLLDSSTRRNLELTETMDRHRDGRQEAPPDDRAAARGQGDDRVQAGRRGPAVSKHCGPRRDARISAARIRSGAPHDQSQLRKRQSQRPDRAAGIPRYVRADPPGPAGF